MTVFLLLALTVCASEGISFCMCDKGPFVSFPSFSGMSADLSEGLLQGVAGLFSVMFFQKYYSLEVKHGHSFLYSITNPR